MAIVSPTDFTLQTLALKFQEKIRTLWENEASYRKLLDEHGMSSYQAIMKVQGWCVADEACSLQILQFYYEEYVRLGREDLVQIITKLRDPLEDKESVFIDIRAHFANTKDPDYGILFALCFKEGVGTAIDLKKAFEIYASLAEQQHPLALCEMANYYVNGQFVEKDHKKALECYQTASEQSKFYIPHCLWGNRLLEDKKENMEKSLALLELSAAKGISLACLILWVYYRNQTDDVCPNRGAKIFFHAKQAADLKDPLGLVCLAQCYYLGLGVAEDDHKYIDLLHQAIKLGSCRAKYLLAIHYNRGIPEVLEVSPILALQYSFECLREDYSDKTNFPRIKSIFADHGNNIDVCQLAHEFCCKILEGHLLDNPIDSFIMARFYQEGFLVPRDFKKAVVCFRKAACLGSKVLATKAANKLMSLFKCQEETSLSPFEIFDYYEHASESEENKTIYEKALVDFNNFMPFLNALSSTWDALNINMPEDIGDLIAEYAYSAPVPVQEPEVQPQPPIVTQFLVQQQLATNDSNKPRSSWCKCVVM